MEWLVLWCLVAPGRVGLEWLLAPGRVGLGWLLSTSARTGASGVATICSTTKYKQDWAGGERDMSVGP